MLLLSGENENLERVVRRVEDISGSMPMRGTWLRVCAVIQGGLDSRLPC